MSTHLTIHEHGDMFTCRLTSTAMGATIQASLHGKYLYAQIDGLLWWAINRKLDSLVAASMTTPAPGHRDEATEWGNALYSGEELVMHVFTTPFYEADEDRQARIVRAINKHLPKLQPLTRYGALKHLAAEELRELEQLCKLLEQRIAHPSEALCGLDGMITKTMAAA